MKVVLYGCGVAGNLIWKQNGTSSPIRILGPLQETLLMQGTGISWSLCSVGIGHEKHVMHVSIYNHFILDFDAF